MSRIDRASFAWACKAAADIIHEAVKKNEIPLAHDAKWNRLQARALAEVSAYLDAKGDAMQPSGEMTDEHFDDECAGDES